MTRLDQQGTQGKVLHSLDKFPSDEQGIQLDNQHGEIARNMIMIK